MVLWLNVTRFLFTIFHFVLIQGMNWPFKNVCQKQVPLYFLKILRLCTVSNQEREEFHRSFHDCLLEPKITKCEAPLYIIDKNNVMLGLWTTCIRTTYLNDLSFLQCHTGSYICTFTRIIASSYVRCWYDKCQKKCYKMTHIYLLISPNVFIRFTIIF